MDTFLDPLSDFFSQFLIHQRLIAPIFLLLIEESGIPIPIPGDAIIAFTGYNVSQGHISFPVAFILIIFSVLAGSTILFHLSKIFGHEMVNRFGKYLHVNEEKLVKVEKEFKKYGPLVIIFGRHIPGFRIPITIFAGMSGVSYKTFILSTFISTVFWILFYLYLGARLGRRVATLFRTGSYQWWFGILILFIFAGVIFYFWQKGKEESPSLKGQKETKR